MKNTLTKYSAHKRSSYTLKGYKCFKEMSEETLCFHTTILCDGKEVGTVKNDGHGGCDYEDFNSKADAEAYAEAAKVLPPYKYEDGSTIEQGTEGLTMHLIAEHDAFKSAKKYFTFYTPENGIDKFGQVKVGGKLMKRDDPRLATKRFWNTFFRDVEEVVLGGMGAWVPEEVTA